MKNILEKLAEGNQRYRSAACPLGDVSQKTRQKTAREGQSPYAIIVTCSDSRVIPEAIFSAGIGDLFVIRVAGNVIDNYQLASIEYAVEHLGCKVVVILGHTDCGAVAAALAKTPTSQATHQNNVSENTPQKEMPAAGYLHYLIDEIIKATHGETNPNKATCLNAINSAHLVRKAFASEITAAHSREEAYAHTNTSSEKKTALEDVTVVAALYHIDDGYVEFLED